MKIILKGEINKKPTKPGSTNYVILGSLSLADLKKVKVKLQLRSQAIAVKSKQGFSTAEGIESPATATFVVSQVVKGIYPPLPCVNKSSCGIYPPSNNVFMGSRVRYGIYPPLTVYDKKKNKKWKKR